MPETLSKLTGQVHEFTGDKDNYLTGNNLYLDNKDFAFVCDFITKVPQGILFHIFNQNQYWSYISLYFSVGNLYLSWSINDYSMSTYLLAENLSDGQIHHINLVITPNHPDKIIFILGQGNSKIKTIIPTSYEPEKIMTGKIYLGGAPWNLPIEVLKLAGTFTGGIANVFFQTKGKLIANLRNFI